MAVFLRIKNRNWASLVARNLFFARFLYFFRRTLVASLTVTLVWLFGFSLNPTIAIAAGTTVISGDMTSPMLVSTSAEDVRMSALIVCLPKQLSQPNLKRALGEMRNDQLERMFNLKSNPKRSQAETDLASCLDRQAP